MRLFFLALAFAFALALAACDDAAKLEKLADEVCGCNSTACLTKAAEKLDDEVEKLGRYSLSKRQSDAKTRAINCIQEYSFPKRLAPLSR